MMLADPQPTRELRKLYAELVAAEHRGLYSVLGVLAMMVLIASSVFRPAFAFFIAMTVIGALVLIGQAMRRRRNAQAFCRDARLVDAEIITPATRPDHDGGWYQELAIPDAQRAVVARVKRRWPRTSSVAEPKRVALWYAPTSSIVISLDPRGEPALGRVQSRPLPTAALVQR